ncbi:hypothetical protein V7127_02650 [Bacillus sp. JJ1773]|uniref:hypothetical protein n=1 Tax=Bacillus sp. JJ1773 TaxID=3122965 RepID=UPI002FFED457
MEIYDSLSKEIEKLSIKVEMIDQYSQFFMTQTVATIGIIIAIATFILGTAAFFMIKLAINKKVENEVEKKVLKILSNNNPIFHARGINSPNEQGEIILTNDIEGIEQLNPDTLVTLNVVANMYTYKQLEVGIHTVLLINEKGERVIKLSNSREDQEITWNVSWVRINY